MALVKRKVIAVDEDKPEEKTAKAEARDDLGGVLALVPESSRRRRTAKKATTRRQRVKNPSPGKVRREITPEEALAQAWEYTYNNRERFQQ